MEVLNLRHSFREGNAEYYNEYNNLFVMIFSIDISHRIEDSYMNFNRKYTYLEKWKY